MAVGIVFLAALLIVAGADAWQVLRASNLTFVAAAFLTYSLFFVARGVRWAIIVRPHAPRVSVTNAASLTAFGWLVSTFVPMKAGDVARAAMLSRRERATFAHVGGSVAVERLLDVFGLAVVASFGLLAGRVVLADRLPPFLAQGLVIAWILPLVGFAALVGLAVWLAEKPQRSPLTRFVARFAFAFRALTQNWRQLPIIVALTILVCAAQIALFTFVFLALDPHAPILAVLVGVPLFLLTFVVSFVPGNVGTYEAGFVAVFTLVGFDPSVLLASAVAAHVLTMSFVTVLGTIGYAVHRFTPAPQPAAVPEAQNTA